jgi:Fe-S-cluster-containing dehydrogenase component
MKKRFFVFDPSSCFGCSGCVAACVNANKTKGNQHWRKVFKLPPDNGKNNTAYLSMSCNHCEKPACVKACPTEAMKKRREDGIVMHDCKKCLGCRYCQMACPYGAIVWMEDKKSVDKCNMCYQKIDRGEEPTCVTTCFSGALKLLTVDSIDNMDGLEDETIGFVYYKEVQPHIRFEKKFKVPEQEENE